MAGKGLVLTGARARLMFDGIKLMYATNVSYSEEIPQEPVEPLDQFEVAENVETGYRVTFSCQRVRVVTNPLKNADGVVIIPRLRNILTRGEMVAAIEDRPTGLIIANIEGVKATSYRVNIGNRGITLEDVEFTALRIVDESELG